MAAQEPIEGTILTEGLGVGRGTRIEDAKGTVRLDTGGKESGIRGGQGGLDQSAVITIDGREAQVRARAINPLEVKPLITDGEGVSSHAILRAGEILSKSAFDYANRVSDLKADAAVVAFNQKARQSFFGSDDGATPGFISLKGQSAVDSRQQYFGQIDNDMSDIIASVDPEVRQKAAARLQGIRDQALNRASDHIVRAQHEAEMQMKFAKTTDLMRDLSVDSSDAAVLKDAYLSHYGPDIAGGSKGWDTSIMEAVDSRYNRVIENGPSGIAAIEAFKSDVWDTLGQEGRNNLDKYIKAQIHHEKAAEPALRAAQERERVKYEDSIKLDALKKMDDSEFTKRATSASFVARSTQDPDTVNFITRAAREQLLGGPAKEDDESNFDTKYLYGWRKEGKVVDFNTFYDAARSAGVQSRKSIVSMFEEHQKPLTQDMRVLDDERAIIINDIIKSYSPDKKSDKSAILLAYLEGKKPDEAAVRMGTAHLPKEAKDLINSIYSASNDSTKSPLERSKNMRAVVVEAKAAKSPSKEAVALGDYTGFSEAYHVKSYISKLEASANQSVVSPAGGKALDPRHAAAAELLGGDASAYTYDRLIRSLEKSGYSNVQLENGKFTGYYPGKGKINIPKPTK